MLADLYEGKPITIQDRDTPLVVINPVGPLSLYHRWVLFSVLVQITHVQHSQLDRESDE